MNKVPTKLGISVNKPEVIDPNNCVWNLEDPVEFEITWNRIIVENGFQNDQWLKGLFDIRKRWVPAFYKGTFTPRVRTTQRSESMMHIMIAKKILLWIFLCALLEQSKANDIMSQS